MGFQMTLSTLGSVVSGTGTWAGEACCSGTVSVTGLADDAGVKLDTRFTADRGSLIPPFTQHFEGQVRGFNTLSGTLTANTQSIGYSYRRIP